MKYHLVLNLQKLCKNLSFIPSKVQFTHWIKKCLTPEKSNTEITIRIVNKKEIQSLNYKYRGKNKTTNILSFSYQTNGNIVPNNLLGDLVICGEIVEYEAILNKKKLESHWAHLTIHGILHLLMYNHSTLKNAKVMESKEINLMKILGYNNPYPISLITNK